MSANLLQVLGITERNLALRRDFVRLDREASELLRPLVPWIEEHAPAIARRFYDWQFSFAPTKRFFDRIAAARELDMPTLRQALEQTQATYLVQVFQGAERQWPLDYFLRRLVVGEVHQRIDLPFKWYIGSYAEMQTQVREELERDSPLAKDPRKTLRVVETINRVFNLDMQAVGDAFLLSILRSVGFDLASIPCDEGTDRTEHLDTANEQVRLLLQQAERIARYDMHAAALDERVPGQLGSAFASMIENTRSFASQVLQNSRALEYVAGASNELGAAIGEISNSSGEAAGVVTESVEAARAANARMAELSDRTEEIGKALTTIATLANQTNLLSLNATIEAARSGDAGKGFAVVANEVKALARRSGEATEEIRGIIGAITSASEEVQASIRRMEELIARVNDLSTSIAGAVEEQTAVTDGLAGSVAEAARTSKELAERLQAAT